MSKSKSKRINFTDKDKAATRQAEDAHRMGLPIAPAVRRQLTLARKKMNLMRYGKADVS